MKAKSKIKMARSAKLYDCGKDVSKQWFVYFQCRNSETDKMERVKISDGFGQYKTIEEKTAYGKRLIDSINLKLKNGWNPFYKQGVYYRLVEATPIYESNLLSYHLELALASCKTDLRKKSYQSYQSHLRGFLQWVSEKKLQKALITEFTKEQARQFIDYLITEKGLTRKTRNGYLVTLKMLFSKIKENDIISNNPFEKIKKIKHSSVSALYFEDYQRQILKEHISAKEPQLWLFVQFMFFCFIRPNELRFIKIGDIHGNKVQIRGEISKNKKTEYVAIPKPLQKVVLENNLMSYPKNYYLFGKSGHPSPYHWGVNHFGEKHAAILKQLGFSNQHSLYSWKHSGVIFFYKEMKTNLHDIMRQLRHHSLEMVQEYLKSLTVMESSFANDDFDDL